ncbi:sigma-54-dependent Fis family transcriptional regulator [Rhodoferax sp. PAMC 29310]|uniref:sigma-54-dependent Fis family transcriptional regulator n=1 Tax=Rhodoferax sp. PAMC 29310 TaxID=2822760 RepID=UPI00351D089B
MQPSFPEAALRQARLQLIEHGDCASNGLDDRLVRSWQRSLAAGLLPAGRPVDTPHSSGNALRQTMASNHELLAHSRPVMAYLYEQVRHAQGMVVLADQHGTLIHTMGHVDFLGKADQVALSCGASWHEGHRGTNAIGTALAETSGVAIHGAEHFFERNSFLTCTAAPIMSARGELLGILDISGDQRGGHPHTLGLVNTAANMIENRLVIASCKRDIRLHLHPQLEGIGTVAEGIVALSDDGWLVGANRNALAMLQLSAGDLNALPLSRLVDVALEELLTRHRRRPGQPTQIRLRDGSVLFAQVYANLSTVSATSPKAAATATRHADALCKFDTGDRLWRVAADKVRRVLDKPIPVLIQGASGVGKELFARAAHDAGPRRDKPFVAINCAALPEHLIEAELFGYAPGAFTGALREGSLGRLREADGGTLFLDEIGDMPLAMQTRLLRVLQERRVTPVGGGHSVAVDFALVCATHFKLREDAEQGRFRSDLYYRINGLTVQLPALRERSDFAALTAQMLGSFNPGREIQLAPALHQRLSEYDWPGNLRQYANVLRTASAMLDTHDEWIDEVHLPDDMIEAL